MSKKKMLSSSIAGNFLFNFLLMLVAFTTAIFFLQKNFQIDWSFWHSILVDGTKVWQIGGVYGDNWNSQAYNPFPLPNPLKIGFALALYFQTLVIVGRDIARKLLFDRYFDNCHLFTKVLLSILPGYLVLSCLVRIGTRFTNAQVTSYILLTVSLILLYRIIINAIFSFRSKSLMEKNVRFTQFRFSVIIGLAYISLFFFFLVWSLQNARNFMVMDSNILFISDISNNFILRTTTTIPIFGKQSDEYFANLFPIIISGEKESALFWFWITNALGKLSLVSWLFVVTRTLLNFVKPEKGDYRIPAAAVSMGFCLWAFLGSASLDPSKYVELWGGSNPLIRTGHLGRYFVFLIPIWIISILASRKLRDRILSTFIGFTLLSGTSITNIFLAILIFGIIFITRSVYLLKFRSSAFPIISFVTAILLCHFLPFWFVANYGSTESISLLMISFVVVITFSLVTLRRFVTVMDIQTTKRGANQNKYGIKFTFTLIVTTALALILGALTWGNSQGISLLRINYEIFPKLSLLARPLEGAIFLDYGATPKFGQWISCTPVTPACSTLNGFISFYGLVILSNFFVAVMVVLPGRLKINPIYAFMMLFHNVIWLFFNVFLWMYGSSNLIDYWILARVLEFPVYVTGLFLSVCVFLALTQKRKIAFGLLTITWLVWSTVPIYTHYISRQFVENLSFFVSLFRP